MRFEIVSLIIFFSVISCKEDVKQSYASQNEEVFISTKEIPASKFLGDNNCKECHKEQYNDWKGSHHDKAMQLADSISVLGNFNDEKFTSQGVTSHFFKRDSSFYVN
ncbi:MAG: hypothetical protein KDC90_19265, partial [Ignavibacteriae bacterium]|nr:hypothetical protein [Ignavibacteriota bacterium]